MRYVVVVVGLLAGCATSSTEQRGGNAIATAAVGGGFVAVGATQIAGATLMGVAAAAGTEIGLPKQATGGMLISAAVTGLVGGAIATLGVGMIVTGKSQYETSVVEERSRIFNTISRQTTRPERKRRKRKAPPPAPAQEEVSLGGTLHEPCRRSEPHCEEGLMCRAGWCVAPPPENAEVE